MIALSSLENWALQAMVLKVTQYEQRSIICVSTVLRLFHLSLKISLLLKYHNLVLAKIPLQNCCIMSQWNFLSYLLTQPSIFPRSIKWVPGTPVNLMAKNKLWLCSLRPQLKFQLNHNLKGDIKCFLVD